MLYRITPQAQISAAWPLYSCFEKISGAMKDGVPQKSLSFSLQEIANPKSIIFTLYVVAS